MSISMGLWRTALRSSTVKIPTTTKVGTKEKWVYFSVWGRRISFWPRGWKPKWDFSYFSEVENRKEERRYWGYWVRYDNDSSYNIDWRIASYVSWIIEQSARYCELFNVSRDICGNLLSNEIESNQWILCKRFAFDGMTFLSVASGYTVPVVLTGKGLIFNPAT